MLNRPFARYTIAVVAVALALVWRLAMVSALHAELPTYLTFYPAVMLVALLAGQWAGLVATALSALVVSYWVLPPVGQFAIEKPADAVGLALFCLMGVFMSVVAERYGRSRERAAAAEKELALQRSKAALAESEERFRLLVEGAKDHAIFMLDPEGRVASWNSGAQSIKGYTEQEIIGRHISCFYVPEDVEHGEPERLLKAAAERGTVEDEGWRVRKDGSRFWAEVALSVLRDDAGRILGFSKVTRNITEHKRAGQRIAHLASFPELNASPILEIDLQGKITYANPAATARFPGIAEIGTNHPILNKWPAITAALGADAEQQVLTREVEADGSVFHQTINYLPDMGLVRVYFADISEASGRRNSSKDSIARLRP